MEICTETWWREPVSCAEILYRELEQGSYFEIFNSDLLWKFLLGYTDSLTKGSCTAASIENLSRRSCARSSTEIFTKGTCRIQPGIFSSRDHLEWTQGFTTWVALVLLAWSPWCFLGPFHIPFRILTYPNYALFGASCRDSLIIFNLFAWMFQNVPAFASKLQNLMDMDDETILNRWLPPIQHQHHLLSIPSLGGVISVDLQGVLRMFCCAHCVAWAFKADPTRFPPLSCVRFSCFLSSPPPSNCSWYLAAVDPDSKLPWKVLLIFFGGETLWTSEPASLDFFVPQKNAKKNWNSFITTTLDSEKNICSHTYVCLKHLRKPSFCICFGWFFPSGTPPAVLNLAGRWRSSHGTRNGFTSWYRSWEHGCAPGTVGP